MRQKQHLDYIYCTCGQTGWNWEIVRVPGCYMLHMEFGRLTQKEGRRKAVKLLRRFETQNVVIGADAEAAKLLQIEDVLFAARQQELLRYQDYIINRLLPVDRDLQKCRHRLLVVLEDPHWERKELRQCILGAKDRLEDIAVCVMTPGIEVDGMIEDIYREWGIVIDILSAEQIRQQYFHMVYFFVVRWRASIRSCCEYQAAYLVSYEGQGMTADTLSEKEKVCSGLKYAIQERGIHEDYGRNLAYQQPEEYQKKGVSVVAICG